MSEILRNEFNEWVRDGRSAGLEAHHRAFADDLIALMDIGARDRILEIGCGEGWASRLLAQFVPEGLVVGLDVSDEMIRKARAASGAFENLLFVWGEAESIPWQERFFSKAFSVESFYYVEHPEIALREIYRVLSPGGSVWILNHLSRENRFTLDWLQRLKVSVQLPTAEEYGKLFESCGFEEYSFRMVPDRTPDDDAAYYATMADAAERRHFKELGALLMTARRPVE
jgi:ubiquinone/menaquinone biosynthesis C-methylase UbiE